MDHTYTHYIINLYDIFGLDSIKKLIVHFLCNTKTNKL